MTFLCARVCVSSALCKTTDAALIRHDNLKARGVRRPGRQVRRASGPWRLGHGPRHATADQRETLQDTGTAPPPPRRRYHFLHALPVVEHSPYHTFLRVIVCLPISVRFIYLFIYSGIYIYVYEYIHFLIFVKSRKKSRRGWSRVE